jgi:hypothetical protein
MADFLFSVFKFILAILLLPVIVAATTGFERHLIFYPSNYESFLMWGIIAFLITFIFVYQFWGMHEFGLKVVAGIFRFIAPFNEFLARLVSFYLLITVLALYVIKNFFHISQYDHYLIFFVGFTLAMHILLVAQELQEQEKTPLKPTYLLSIGLVYIFNILLVVLLLDLVVGQLTFPKFFNALLAKSRNFYEISYGKIFSLDWWPLAK